MINKPEDPKKFGKLLNIPFQMFTIIALGAFGGIKIDKWLDTSPIFALILTVLAVILAIYYSIKDLK